MEPNDNLTIAKEFQDKYWKLFVSRSDIYAIQQPDGQYYMVNSELSEETLFGVNTVGLYQLDKDSKVKWAVIDFDIEKKIAKDDPEFNFDDWKGKMQLQVRSVSELLTLKGIPHYIEFSGFRGYHIWIFFDGPVQASKVKAWMDEISGQFEKIDESITFELFPKQTELGRTDDGKVKSGSLVKAPLQRHLKTGLFTHFVDSEFKSIDRLPEITFCKEEQLIISDEVKIKQAPKNFSGIVKTDSGHGSLPAPDNIMKMVNGCKLIKDIVKKAAVSRHLLNDERIIIASVGRFFGEKGLKWIHSVLSHCTDYDERTTNYHISMLTRNPVKCETMRSLLKLKCDMCKNSWSTPLSFGYTTVQEHFTASSQIMTKGYLPQLLSKLGMTYSESSNHYITEHNNNTYYISKPKGTWMGKFNLIDFVRFIRPDDWELFLNQNFPDIEVDKFAFERTDKTIQEIFGYDGGEIKINRYISEADRQVDMILSDSQNYNIIADTGLGKTEAIIKKIKEKNLKAIFLTPYESNARQLQEKYGVFSVHGNVKLSTVKEELGKRNIIVSTYDGLKKILSSQISPEEYILLVDEVHNIVTHANFRGYALGNILKNMHEFKKVVTITGTPEGVLNNDYKKVRFVRSGGEKLVSDYTVLVSKADPDSAAIEHMLENGYKGKVIIFKNSIKSLEEIKEVLIEKGISSDEIQILHSQEKESETYGSIVKDEKIPDSVKYILTTSVISDGVNIGNENIDAVYLLECQNLIQLRQFVARFRKGVRNIVDIVPDVPAEMKKVKWFDYPVELKRITSQYEVIAETKTKFLRECGMIPNSAQPDFIKKVMGKVSREMDFLRLNHETKEVEVNYQLLSYDILSDFHRVAYLNPEKRKEYLEHTLNIKVSVKEIAASSFDTSAAREKVKARMEENRGKLIDLLSTSPNETITCYLKNVNPNMIRNKEEYLKGIYINDHPTDGFFLENKGLLRLKEAERLIGKYITFSKYKFPHDFIIELLRKGQNEVNDFELGYLTQLVLYLVSNHKKILKYSKKSMKVFHYAVFKFIYDYFGKNITFTYAGLLKELNHYLLSDRVAEVPVGKGVLAEVLKRIIKKVKWTEKRGKQTKTLGWKFVGFKTIGDLAGNDSKKEEIIKASIKDYLENEISFARFSLLIDSLRGDMDGYDSSEQMDLLNELKKDLGRLSQ